MDKTEAREASAAMTEIVRARLMLQPSVKQQIDYFQQEEEAARDARTLSPANPQAADRQARDNLAFDVARDPERRSATLRQLDQVVQRETAAGKQVERPEVITAPRDAAGPVGSASTAALRFIAGGLSRLAGDPQPKLAEEVEVELLRRQYQVARIERSPVELVVPATDKDRAEGNALLRTTGLDPALVAKQSARASIELVARQELEAAYQAQFGTPVGARSFAGRVVDRIAERIEQDPALAGIRSQLAAAVPPGSRLENTDPQLPRDPVLQREETATLVAAQLIAIDRQQREPTDENRARAGAIESEISYRRTDPSFKGQRPFSGPSADLDQKQLQAGTELLSRMEYQRVQPDVALDRSTGTAALSGEEMER